MPSLLPTQCQGRFYLRATNVIMRIIIKEHPTALKDFSSFNYFLAVLLRLVKLHYINVHKGTNRKGKPDCCVF